LKIREVKGKLKGKPLSYLPQGEMIPSGWKGLLPLGEAGERLKGRMMPCGMYRPFNF